MSVTPFKIADWSVNADELLLSNGDESHQLPAKVFKVLILLSDRPGETLTRDFLIEEVWNGHFEVGTKGLNNAIYQLRKILKSDENEGIKTVSKLGYQLTLPVEKSNNKSTNSSDSVSHFSIPKVLSAFSVLLILGFIIYTQFNSPSKINYGKPDHLTYYEGVEELPSISSDGKSMAFTWERKDEFSQIYIRSLVDKDAPLKQITFDDGSETSPAFSPDNSKLAYVRVDGDKRCQVLVKELESLKERVISSCYYKRFYRSVDWSPSGKYLAYTKVTTENKIAVFKFNLETEAETQLTFPSGGAEDIQLAWGKVEDQLAIVRNLNLNSNLVLIDLDGNENYLLKSHPPIYGLTWNQDDSAVLINTPREGDFSIWQYSIDSEKLTNIYRDSIPYNLDSIPGSENGFVYSAHQSREFIGVYSLSQSEKPLAESEIHSSQRNMYAQHSSVSNKFVFISNRNGFYEIWTSNYDGSSPQQVTDKQGLIGLASWSPTQDMLAFTLKENGEPNHSLYVSNQSDKQFSRLTADSFEYQYPVWSEDGKSILVSSNRGGNWNIWRYTLYSGNFQQLTFSGANFAIEAESNIYFTRESKVGIWKLNLKTNEEELVIPNLTVGDWGNFFISQSTLYYPDRNEKDQIIEFDLETSQKKVLMSFNKNSIKGNRSIALVNQDKIAITLLGPSEADILAVYPVSE